MFLTLGKKRCNPGVSIFTPGYITPSYNGVTIILIQTACHTSTCSTCGCGPLADNAKYGIVGKLSLSTYRLTFSNINCATSSELMKVGGELAVLGPTYGPTT